MAHNLHIGQTVEDFAAFESAIMRYQNAENVQFYRRDFRRVDKAQPRLEKKLNPKIKYYEVKYHCINGGKKHISKATVAREGIKGCSISNYYDFVSPFSVPLNSSVFFSQQRLRVHFRTASMTLTHYDNTSMQYIATEFNGC